MGDSIDRGGGVGEIRSPDDREHAPRSASSHDASSSPEQESSWQPHRERRALTQAGTGRMHRSPVQLHELPDDAQAKTKSCVTLRRGVVTLAKALEDMRQKVGIDALAAADDPDLGVALAG